MGQECISLSTQSWQIPLWDSDLWLYKFPCLMSQLSGGRVGCSCGHFNIQDQDFWILTDCSNAVLAAFLSIISHSYWKEHSPVVRRAGPEESHRCLWGRPGESRTGPAVSWRPWIFWFLLFLAWELTKRTGAAWIRDTPEMENAILWVTLISWFYQIVSTK